MCFWLVLGIAAVALVAGSVLVVILVRSIPLIASQTPTPAADWILAHRGLLWAVGPSVLVAFTSQIGFLFYFDICTKMLIFMRGQQAARSDS